MREQHDVCRELGLSMREREIVQCVLADYSDGEIAYHLRLSTHTVHTYVARLYRKAYEVAVN